VDTAKGEVRVAEATVTMAATAKTTKKQNSAPLNGARSSDIHYLVGLAGFSLSPALASYLHERREAVAAGVEPVRGEPVHTPVPKRQPVASRLSDAQVTAIVERYRSGETARSLAAEFGLGLTAMKSLLQKCGARKRS
jgi:hypothetical protein